MKKLLLTAAAAVAVTAVAGAANAQEWTTGYVGGTYSTINTGQGTSNDDASIFAARGVISNQLTEGVEVQIDGDFASIDLGASGASNVNAWGPTLHTFVEGEGGSKFGVILGFQDIEDNSIVAYGAEARFAATDQISLGFGAVWGSMNVNGTRPNVDLRSYRGEASYFVSDDFRIDATITSFRASNSAFKSSQLTYGIGGEVQLSSAPVSILFGYERVQTGGGGNNNYDAFTLGARHSFGGTLKDRDRTSSPFPGLSGFFGTGGMVELAVSACAASSDSESSGCFGSDDEDDYQD